MGGSSGGGGGGKPPPPSKPPPPAEDLQAEYIAPTIVQEAARRAKSGAYTTKGQKLGAGGEVLGAGPIELANVADATGLDMSTKQIKRSQASKYFTGFGGGKKLTTGFTGRKLENLKKQGYETTTYKVKRKRSMFGGHRTKTFEHITYKDYVKQYNERVAKERSQERKGLEI